MLRFIAAWLGLGLIASLALGEAFPNGFPSDPKFFPLAVWLQAPRNAARYKAIGINTYVGLWRGPDQEQLAQLEKAGMLVVCHQNRFALEQKNRKVIVAWMHGDEPDNAQALPGRRGYGPPILPEKIVEDYKRIKENDPSRPVLLNLGQGVAFDQYIGRGVRSRHPEDYPEYLKGCDIASFDIYPVVHESPVVKGKLEFVGNGVARLRKWSGGEKPVWACIETTHISNVNAKATPEQVRSEVWLAICNGAQGIIYFCHQFKPTSIEAGLLADPEMTQGVARINREVLGLAPILHSPPADDVKGDAGVSMIARRHEGAIYIFAVAGGKELSAKFSVAGKQAEVIGENRAIPIANGTFEDSFRPYQVHHYRILNR